MMQLQSLSTQFWQKSLLKALVLAFIVNTQIIKVFTIISPVIDVVVQGLLIFLCSSEIFEKTTIKKKTFFPFICLYVIVSGIFSSIYSPDTDKLMSIGKLLFTFMTILSVRTFSKYETELFLHYTIYINFIYALIIIAGKLPENDFNYLNLSLSLGACVSIIITRLSFDKFSLKIFLLLIVFILATIHFSSRGVFLFIVLQMIICSFARKENIVRNILILISFSVAFYAYLYLIPHDSWDLGYRILGIIDGDDTLTSAREYIWSSCISLLDDRYRWFFGYGIGACKELIGIYPHNYMLQIWIELGFPSLIFILTATVITYLTSIKKIIGKCEDRIFWFTLLFCLSYYIVQFSKSFDMLSAYPIWIYMTLLIKHAQQQSKCSPIHS